MSNAGPPDPAPPNESEPLPLPSIPDFAPWSDLGPLDESVGRTAAAAPSAPRRSSPTIGHIGRYALKHILGTGGIGTVYAAHDPLLSRVIAVKTLHVEVPEAQRSAFNALFLDEARAAGGLSHPHIVTVHDAGISDQRAYIAMELLKGRDLRKLREEGWRASASQAALIVRRVADALAYAHSKGVVHRDVKPANIFMVGQTQPRVLDFGIARLARESSARTPEHPPAGASPPGSVSADDSGPELAAGSPYYMAPEQVRQLSVDRRADVYSLGVVLYEMLTDVKPFTGHSLADIQHAVLHHQPPPADAVDPAVPSGLARIAARAMEKDPERRYRSARAFAADLRRWLDEESAAATAVAPSASPPAATARRARPGRPAIALGSLALASVAAWGAWSAWPTPPSSAATPMASRVAAPLPAPLPAPTPAPTDTSARSASDPGLDGAGSAPPRGAAVEADPRGDTASAAPVAVAPRPAAAADPAQARELVTVPAAPRATDTAVPKGLRGGRDRVDARSTAERRGNVPTPVPSAPVAEGLVRLAVSPWGQVEVDGAAVGTAPPLHELSLREGRHQIVIRNADFPPFTAVVQVVPHQPVVLKHRFGS